jgi:hypothetical protein
MRIFTLLIFTLCFCQVGLSQPLDIPKVKSELEKTTEPLTYVKTTLKKKYKIDTIAVYKLSHFMGIADSLAYHGKLRKVYGPFPGENILVQILGKAPNLFYRARQILIDTSVFKKKVADSIANNIIRKLKSGTTDFESMNRVYSPRNAVVSDGDLVTARDHHTAIGKPILAHKKGEFLRCGQNSGCTLSGHETPKEDTGFAMMLRIFYNKTLQPGSALQR